MKKFCFWVLGAVFYEAVIVCFGSYWIGTRLGNSFLEMKNIK